MYVSINSAMHARVPSLLPHQEGRSHFRRHARIVKSVGWTANSGINHGFGRTFITTKRMHAFFRYHFNLVMYIPIFMYLFHEIKHACLFHRMKLIIGRTVYSDSTFLRVSKYLKKYIFKHCNPWFKINGICWL